MKKRFFSMVLAVCLIASVCAVPAMAHGHHGSVTHRPVTRPIVVVRDTNASLIHPFSDTLPFADVEITDWFVDAVRFVYHEDIMKGVSVTEFSPDGSLTRAMAAQILYNMAACPGAAAADFTDVTAADWYEDAVGWAASMDIIRGFPDGSFRPNEPVTREQIVTMLHRFAKARDVDRVYLSRLDRYTDRDEIGAWSFSAMQWAAAEELLNDSCTELRPKDTATRAEVAQLLWNFCSAAYDDSTFIPGHNFGKFFR